MRLQIVLAMAACSLVGAAILPVHADDTMRCGSRLVYSGDSKDKVRTICGEPTSVSFAGVVSGPRYYNGPYDYSYFGPGWIEVPVEIWTYNQGSSKLLRKLRFIGDQLDEIWADGYGY